MIPLKMRRLFFGFTPRRLLGMNGSILAHCPSLNQNKFARICWPPDSVDQPVESQHGSNWVLTLEPFRYDWMGTEAPASCFEVPRLLLPRQLGLISSRR
jgi:hypothetical protein